ncbi:alcohol dehydrogenase catalytic domain-containing protein [Streptomyces sp. NPDC079167]|uniref:zinc-dependent alcohol dehydrogenase n=1 Tax=Streptomyces sp. NPDC079167 TaxID=3154513 RepID=UPI0034347D4F
MSAAVLVTRPGVHKLVTQGAAPLGASEALVRIHSNGLCHSDADILSGTRPSDYVRYPLIPGHEWSGVVEGVGSEVSDELVGRKVVGESIRGCGACVRCRAGENTLCLAGYEETGFTKSGGLAETVVVPVRCLHVLPDDADLAAAALLEPAACAMAAVLKASVLPHESVIVIGDGVPGLLVAQLLTGSGARRVTIAGSGGRRQLALQQGAAAYVSPGESIARQYDVAIHTAGDAGSASLPLLSLRPGGRLICTNSALAPLSPSEIVRSQLTVQSVFGASSQAWAFAVTAFTSGELMTSHLITHTFALDAYGEAVGLVYSGDPTVGKVLLRLNEPLPTWEGANR